MSWIMIKIMGFIGLLLLVLSLFVPIAYLGNNPIFILQITGSEMPGTGWDWLNIAAFAITYCLLIIIEFILILKKNYIGVILSISIQVFCALIFLVAIWMTSFDSSQSTFSLSYSWMFIISGLSLTIFTANKIRKNKLHKE